MRIPCLDLDSWPSRSVWTAVFGLLIPLINLVKCGGGDLWPLERPEGMPSIQSLEVMCGKDHMDVHLSFSHPFEGIVSSKGQHGDPRCIYVPPSTGQTFFSFRIAYARCGTKPDLNGQFYENTVVVQYDKDLLEVWDEAKRLRCEWFNDYEKTASKPPMVIADLDVIQLDFRGDNVDCWMEIQHGKGPWAPPVSGIVPLGSTLTLVVAINDYRGEFDMRVKSCLASDGGGHVIQLSDEFGCVLRPKMISRFLKARGADERASVITYAFFHAFKFPDALSVHIKCKVEICRHGCLDHCQVQPGKRIDLNTELHRYADKFDRKDEKIDDEADASDDRRAPPDANASKDDDDDDDEDDIYDDIIQEGEGGAAIGNGLPGVQMALNHKMKGVPKDGDYVELGPGLELPQSDKFPQGPRNLLDADTPVAAPRSFASTTATPPPPAASSARQQRDAAMARDRKRRKRSLVVSDRKARSADVGVSSIYEVISEADLAFSPDTKAEAVTVFQGKIREEVVYGICMPVPGFSILFIVVALSAVVSALVAGTLLYRYQLQRERFVAQTATVREQRRRGRDHRQQEHQNGAIAMHTFVNWMGVRLLKANNANNGKRVAKTMHQSASNGDASYEKKSNGKTDD